MPRPSERNHTKRKIFVKATKGTRIHYVLRKPGKAQCASCSIYLSGVPHLRPFGVRRMSKSEKRPERPFGGVLCSKCSTKLIKESARNV
jgi:large subunit ribosomal protein L34e